MKVRLTNLRLPAEAPEAELKKAIAHKLQIKRDDLPGWRILRKSLDARSKYDIKFVYSVVVTLPDDPKLKKKLAKRKEIEEFDPKHFDDPEPGTQPLEHRPIVVGTGPAGLLAGYYLARKGYRPILIDRGFPVKERVPQIRAFDRQQAEHDNENNYLFGEGGAGAFSDGKLTCRMTGPDVDWVLESFVECGSRESIRYEHRPHLGSNKLPMICRNYRRKIEALGGEYRFECRLEGFQIDDGQVRGIETSSGVMTTDHVILAIGHSARDTYEMLHSMGMPMQAKAFQLGLRIEQPQENVNKWKYGQDRYLDLLGAADYTIVAKGQPDLYTFCMCAGGTVIPSISEPNQFCTNGMSNSRHDTKFANSGLMVTLDPKHFGSDHPLAGVELQRKFEAVAFEIGNREYHSPIQRAKHFLKKSSIIGETSYPSSYQRGTVSCDLRQVLPTQVLQGLDQGLPIMDEKMKGAFLKGAMLLGPEMRGSAPLRMDRDRVTRESPGIRGLYPVGEGAGYAGGIITAAVDGLRSAREIVRKYAPATG
ncbi:NAD(P)/FAD-dependent oxidoreductase [Thalassoglobus polymorphus]|uniref:D-amino acid dehydrogenase small subunit n=1 Tax=Thalassoglobus polymorphus TaxID=2527994 RepID=A0A517QLQ4_9PLAN|nr:FAD-dependent oxidoreductase [Thalassoglobus polymorphus]QDT32549.1 D-amino acid dehydrogenase small subunit [Thalassoglobus polymorphus]